MGAMSLPKTRDINWFSSDRSEDLVVSAINMKRDRALLDNFTDWSVTASWNKGDFQVTMAHGIPFAYFESVNGIQIETLDEANIWYQNGKIVGLTVGANTYGIYAPESSVWKTDNNTISSDLNNKSYCSIALLPDNTEETLLQFANHAYNFISDTKVSWEYDRQAAELKVYYTVQFDRKEAGSNQTILALYPHQWLYCDTGFLDFSYGSVRGEMKVLESDRFTTITPFYGILPALPLVAEDGINGFDENKLKQYIADEFQKTDDELIAANIDTYWTGKGFGRTAQLVRIADQLGMPTERDRFLNVLKSKLEDWFTYTPGEDAEYFYYNEDWGTLIGVKPSYGSDAFINDHHFHYGYYIMAAATIAQYDLDWANTWKDMVELLIRDVYAWDRDDELFPFLRVFDIYAGHAWASGAAEFWDGNNQESSSEEVNCEAAIALWGMATQNEVLTSLGVYLYTTATTAIENYWFDVHAINFPQDFNHTMLGMIWSTKADYATWFGGYPDHVEYIHGINFLPITAASLYLGSYPDYAAENYAEANNYTIDEWQGIMWNYLALSDPARAVSNLEAYPNYAETNGSHAHTYHWIHNLNAMGHVDRKITANVPSFAVFDNEGQKVYVVYNPAFSAIDADFSDGKTIAVPARTLTFERGTSTGLHIARQPEVFIYMEPGGELVQIAGYKGKINSITVYNGMGQKVFQTSEKNSVPQSLLPRGVNLFEIQFDTHTEVMKWMKSR